VPGIGTPGLPSRAPGESLARARPDRPVPPDVWAEATGARRPADSADGSAAEQRTGTPETGPDGFRGSMHAGGDGAAQPGYRPGGENGNDNWSSWWTRTTPSQPGDAHRQQPDQSVPAPQPEPNGSTPAGPTQPDPADPARPDPTHPDPADPEPLPEPRPPADGSPQLHRRVPQANLAAGLRRESEQPAPEQSPVVRDPLAARNALSRFQAAQRAARDVVEGDPPNGGPFR
jgi:hypothetical protein